MIDCISTLRRLGVTTAMVATVLFVQSDALAARRAVVEARAGYPYDAAGSASFGAALNCWGHDPVDLQNSVRWLATNGCSAIWFMPIPMETRVGGGTVNTWMTVAAGSTTPLDLEPETFYGDGTLYTSSTLRVTASGRYQLPSITVPQDGTADIGVVFYSYWTRIDTFEYEYNF